MSESPSLRQLLDQLRRDGDADVASDDAIRQHLADAYETGADDDPWYIRSIAGAGAWLTAATLVGFLSCSGLIDFEGISPFVWGTLFVALGVGVHHGSSDRGVYPPQFALASSLTGQALLVGGFEGTFGLVVAWFVQTLLAGLLYVVYPRPTHRLLSVLATFGLTMSMCIETVFPPGLIGLFAVETLLVATVFAPDRTIPLSLKRSARPMGYASALGLVGLGSELFLTQIADVEHLGPYRGLAAAALIYLVYRSVESADRRAFEPAAWAAGGIALLSGVATPGVLVALLILYVGVWRGTASLMVLGITALGYHLWEFYYSLSMTLWTKSWMLIASGSILLALRWWFRGRPWMETDEGAS